MILWPIFWIFGLVVIIFMTALAIAVVIALLLSIRKHKKTKVPVRRSVIIMLAILIVFVSVASYMASRNVWHWMSELNISDNPREIADKERREVWYQFQPFRDNAQTVTADFESVLIITENYPRLDGATAFLPVYSAVAETIYSGLDVNSARSFIDLSTTRQAFELLMQGRKDIIFTLQPSQAQIEDAQAVGVEFIKTPIFKEAFVFFVNDANPVTELTVEQIQQIYTGTISNWQDVGGRNESIAAYQRNANSGSQTTMEQVVMDGLRMIMPATELQEGTMGMMLRSVAQYTNHEQALGYSFRFYTTVMNPQDGLRMLAVDGIAPTPENIANDSYPFTVNVYAITTAHGLENPHTQEIIDWLVSPQGQRLIEQVGYVGLTTP
jgi:phosphate transport system substrate-binding protein